MLRDYFQQDVMIVLLQYLDRWYENSNRCRQSQHSQGRDRSYGRSLMEGRMLAVLHHDLYKQTITMRVSLTRDIEYIIAPADSESLPPP